jgi:cyclopropane fatty-acyl-phospholipid synthase-like methyltransferase
MAKIPGRFFWAAETIQVQPDDTVLEIGCGAGLLAELIAEGLLSGNITAIDKSVPMITLAMKRNARFIESGTARFIAESFSTFEPEEVKFDRIVAFNVNFFWKDNVAELEKIRALLKPDGRLFMLYQPPYYIRPDAADPVMERLKKHGFEIVELVFKKMIPVSAFCIIAKV